jgi:hypothetical protein
MMVKTLTLMADYSCFGWIHRGPIDEINPPIGGGTWDGVYWGKPGDDEILDKDLRRDLKNWHRRFETSGLLNPEQAERFDWQTFHDEGVALCRRIRAIFGDGYRVRYEKPFEDPSCRATKHAVQIELDGSITSVPWDQELHQRELTAQVEASIAKHAAKGENNGD